MRAVRFIQGRVEVARVRRPQGDGVRVRIRSAGICGSDLHMLDTGFPIDHTVGHEMAGELGDGTPVAIEPIVACGECDCCARGAYNLCRSGPAVLMGVGLDGGMAEEVLVPERCLVALAGGVAVADACLVEPLAVVVHGLRRAAVAPPERIAIIGGGTLGLCAVAAARALGVEVGFEARHEAQREAGARLGAVATSGEYDVVVDCAGSKSALETAAEWCRPDGTLLLLATYWDGLELPRFQLCSKELRVVPASLYARHGEARDVDTAAQLLATEPEIARAIITHRLPLDAAREAFQLARDRKSGAIKVVLEP